MILEIVTPEMVVFSGQVDSVAVPGVNGEFQMLNLHAPVVSLLTKGSIRIFGDVKLNDATAGLFKKANGTTNLEITGGVIEMAGNKAIILAD